MMPPAIAIGAGGASRAEASDDFGRWVTLLSSLRTLPDKPEEDAAGTLRALWHLAAGCPLSIEAAQERPLPELDTQATAQLEQLITRRLNGEPLAHLTGRQRFLGIDLLAGPQALIPRKETEILGAVVLDRLAALALGRDEILAADICTGSGNLAIVMARHQPRLKIVACDLSQDAVELARRNAEFCGVQARVEVRQGDLLQPLHDAGLFGRLDLVVCNPPYISSPRVADMAQEISAHEPKMAFDGGPFGVRILQRLIREAPAFLRQGGVLAFEVGLGQGRAVLERLRAQGDFADITPVTDAHEEIRVLMATRV